MISTASNGYTILEVMIFLAISSVMFVIAIISVSGRQEQVRFTQAVREFDSVVQDIVNDVGSGFFPTRQEVGCTIVSGSPQVTVPSSNDLGTNEECVLIGKALQFAQDDGDPATIDGERIHVYNIVGRRVNDLDNTSPTTLEDAQPTGVPIADVIPLEWGLKVTAVGTEAAPTDSVGAMGVFSSLNRSALLDSSSTNEAVVISEIPTTTFGQNESDLIDVIDRITDQTPVPTNGVFLDFNNASPVVICLSDANEDRKASITIGIDDNSTRVDFDTYNVAVCGA